jgi:transcriptional regulator with XRE-family HTH domain
MFLEAEMTKPLNRAYSRYSLEATALMGQMIRAGRIERKITAEEIASRMGIFRALLQRIEKGDPGCGIGAVFEAAAIAGVPLFETDRGQGTVDLDRERISAHRAALGEMLTLLPKTARKPRRAVKDDF